MGKCLVQGFFKTRGNQLKRFYINKKFVQAFLKIGKGHAALEIIAVAVACLAWLKFLHEFSEEKEKIKEDVFEFILNTHKHLLTTTVHRNHEELDSNENEDVFDVAIFMIAHGISLVAPLYMV